MFGTVEMVFLGLIGLLMISGIRDGLKGRYTHAGNVEDIMDYHGGELAFGKNGKLKMETLYMGEGLKQIRSGIKLDVIINGKVAESKHYEYLFGRSHAIFQKPWKKDIEKMLKEEYFLLRKMEKEERKQEKEKQKKIHSEFASEYKSSK